MTATPQDIADALASPPDEELIAQCDAGIPARSELVDRIRTSRDQWTPDQYRTMLARLEDWEPPLCAPHCAHERVGAVAVEAGRTFDRIVSLTDDETAAIMTAEATGVANAIRDGIRTGDALLAELVRRLGIDAPAGDEVSYF
jgi:imidazolonepropionase-like amidohydrolase